MRVYGSEISYFTGKLEAYLRYKQIAYELVPMTQRYFNRVIPRATGVSQMPAVELPDGRWMTDTTPMIDWFEQEHPEPRVIPLDPLQGFVSRLLEDYADEWLWRPAMHYRWSHRADAQLLSHCIASELLSDVPGPAWIKRWAIRRRQLGGYVRGDGVTTHTRAHVEAIYLRTLASLEAMLATRPFLLGDLPTLSDFAFFGSMFRHFGSDPTPRAIMQRRAPGVYAWVARMWDARADRLSGPLLNGVPKDWSPLLDDVGEAYLPYLSSNATAWLAKRPQFDVTIQGTPYSAVRTSQYRVWCLEQLRRHYERLPRDTQAEARALLERHRCWELLWRARDCRSNHDPEGRAPFAHGLKVF